MNIQKVVKTYVAEMGWPDATVRVGPGSCGLPCHLLHAYAEAVASTSFRTEEKPMYVFIFARPCVVHDLGMKQRVEERARAAERSVH